MGWISPSTRVRDSPAGGRSGARDRTPDRLLKSFDSDVSHFDLHGRPDVRLYADQAFHLAIGGVVIDQHAHHLAIEDLDQSIAARDQVECIPIALFDEFLQLGIITDRSGASR